MKRIICVDDDPGLQDVFSLIFDRAGYEVTMINNGEQLLENQFEPPDLFLIDKQLSGIDGMEICRFLKGQVSTRNVPVIIISASSNLEQQAKAAGADDFIEKPFQLKFMLELLKKYI